MIDFREAPPRRLPAWIPAVTSLSPGAAVIIALALLSSLGMWLNPGTDWPGRKYWVFAEPHAQMYEPVVRAWNQRHQPSDQVGMAVLSVPAMERRLLSGFLADTPVPDLCEAEVSMAAKFFAGPLQAIGLVDLTDRLRQEGLLERINQASFAPWSSRGRIFGIPHDVHPVLLAYRSDLAEAAGIDVSEIETWDDFVRVFSPLMADRNGDGYPDRYLLNFWETNGAAIEVLLMQAGGQLFDENLRPRIDSEINARVLATLAGWTAGPGRIAANAPNLNAEGNQMFLEGYVLCNLLPDWMAGVWLKDLPGLAGKVKLMPLPAWTPGGRRTSVSGGTMLCFPKARGGFETNWQFARDLYLNPALAEELFLKGAIISPVKDNWTAAYYDAPNPYFSGQAIGRAYIDVAPDVPLRTSSSYKTLAVARVTDALIRLKRRAEHLGIYDREGLLPLAREELAVAQEYILSKMARNRFAEAAR